MAYTLEQLGEKIDRVCIAVEKIEAKVYEMATKQIQSDIHLSSLVNPPNVETRLKSYIDDRDDHKQNNSTQALLQVQTILKQGQELIELRLENQIKEVALAVAQTEKNRLLNHEENKDYEEETSQRLGKLEKFQWLTLGALGALEVILKFIGKG